VIFVLSRGIEMAKAGELFADRLQRLREAKGMSQYALSKATGLSRQTMSQLEKGSFEPSWVTVQLLCMALGVDCREFADPGLRLPDPAPARPRGRPAKGAGASGKPAKGKGKG
jgi:transcriptional regulator with XRE-family HTH domain